MMSPKSGVTKRGEHIRAHVMLEVDHDSLYMYMYIYIYSKYINITIKIPLLMDNIPIKIEIICAYVCKLHCTGRSTFFFVESQSNLLNISIYHNH